MKIFKVSILLILLLVLSNTSIFAQSGRKDAKPTPTPSVNVSSETSSEKKPENKELEETRFIVSGNLSRFLDELNKFGNSGYRVEKALSFGGDISNTQNFAAVLKLDLLDTFEYQLLASPNPNFLESRLNFLSDSGFNPVQSLAITACYDSSSESDIDASIIIPDLFKFNKGDIFLLERVNGIKKKTKDYKVFTGKIGLGKSPSKEIQTALDNVSKEYRPFKVLFNKGGFLDFSVSVLLEDDLTKEKSKKTDFQFVKEVNGFEKEINSLAKTGYKFLSGRRIGLIKYALMAKDSDESFAYFFVEEKKYQKDFEKEVKPTFTYETIFKGDSDCDSQKTIGGKLIFEQNADNKSKVSDFKFLRIKANDKNEIDNLIKDGYQLLDIFYDDEFVAMLAK